MGKIVYDVAISGDQGGRKAGEFHDGAAMRMIMVLPNNVIQFRAIPENTVLYTEYALAGSRLSIQSIVPDTSSYSEKVALIIGGFTPDSDDARFLCVMTDYVPAPRIEAS